MAKKKALFTVQDTIANKRKFDPPAKLWHLLRGSTLKIFFSQSWMLTLGALDPRSKSTSYLTGLCALFFSNWAQWHLASKNADNVEPRRKVPGPKLGAGFLFLQTSTQIFFFGGGR